MSEAFEAGTHLRTLVETMRKNKFHSKPRWYKIGDVIKWTPKYASQDKYNERGLGVVVKAQGPNIQVYWLGNGELTKHDVRMPQIFQLQDLAPMPEVADWLESIEKEYI
tara:strand:+ start:353 stop:679 length:327 start_codon:yes stop_codon:yes gene_type:complete